MSPFTDYADPDLHVTSDGVILMFHDPTLDRTTTGTGMIKTQPWEGVIEWVNSYLELIRHVRTTKEPLQPIPLFEELVALLMEVSSLGNEADKKSENRHVSLNVGMVYGAKLIFS
jgi:glycerophosphoryl diester phosphodiesterase/phosphatidylglycerol phospholipase C